ncbi:helix-turn-helix transcriptional regulator [Pseudooceanicola sp. LIPI14-2-Ac024]|uniref:helix-turn-helix transcriptional regulator n=1 Tax=Pseudooceanicola sp. LIPI14-2-Ac024 TaxID=3344875 RepID=UPI0035D00A5F
MNRKELAKYLTEHGLQTSPRTLEKWAQMGEGPLYQRYRRAAVYHRDDVDTWLATQLSIPTNQSWSEPKVINDPGVIEGTYTEVKG